MKNGSVVGDYRLLEPLGKGGAGQVYLATPTRSKPFAQEGDLVAVKVYNNWVLQQKGQLERIKREYDVGSWAKTNPYLVHIHECDFNDPEQPFLVMEYVDGMPLSDWVKMFHPISEHLLVNILMKVADGLRALHSAGVTHRDLKPENIMVTSDFLPKIMDFGVVKLKQGDGETPSDSFLGTIRNAAPEWLRREELPDDPRMDLYSFGTVIYCLLHGHQVFHEEKQFARLIEMVTREAPKIDQDLLNRPEPIPHLVQLASKLLQKTPEKRFKDCEELIGELDSIGKMLSGSGVEPLHGYIATALTGVSDDAREAIFFKSSLIASVCKSFEIYVYQPRKASDPLTHVDIHAEVVYAMDRKRVLAADLLVVITDQPSLGVGQELEIAGTFGVPTILIRSESAKTKISRMVTGSFMNLVGEIAYSTPEDLESKLRACVGNNLDRIRSFKQTVKPAISDKVGPRLRQMRQDAGMSLEDTARTVGASTRLLQAIEERKLSYHNAGLHLVARMLTAYGKTPGQLFSELETSSPVSAVASDQNILRLENVSRRLGWPASDFLDLRDDYEKRKAAAGDTELITQEEWRRRHARLESRRLQDVQATEKKRPQQDLLFGA